MKGMVNLMRIALLSAAKSIHSIRWANALSKRGHKVALFSLLEHKANDGIYLPQVELHYIKIVTGLGYWWGAGQLKRMLSQFKPDILNAHYATGYGTLARRSCFKPLLLSIWGSDVYDFPYISSLHKRLLQSNLDSATAIASTSNAMAEQVKRVYPCQKEIYITPFGVDCDIFKRISKPQEKILTVGIVKALETKYGVDLLLRAFALLKYRLQNESIAPIEGIRLEIYGSGTQLDKLKKLSAELNIDTYTRFYGAVPHSQVPQIINGFNIFVAPSIINSESFGVAAVEAMACETAVIVSDADGLKEVTVNEVTGFVVPKNDYLTLADKLYILAKKPELREKMGKAGREHVLTHYNWEDNVMTMENALMQTVTLFKQKQQNEAGLNI
jgi:glycosyltransferase involved in cell wall biosynthesis